VTASYEEALALKNSLATDYEEQHSDFKRLRKLWHGGFWEELDNQPKSVSTLFRDLVRRSSDVGPDIKLTYNLLKDVCVKFQTYLAPTPMIQCYVDPPNTTKRRSQANTKERFLYGTWAENRMGKIMADNGWYLPLMGNVFLGAYPDMKTNIVRLVMRSPEVAYPVPNYDGSDLDAVIFAFKAPLSAIQRAYPNFQAPTPARNGRGFRRQAGPTDPSYEVIEYSDNDCFYRWCEGQYLQGTEHGYGFNLFEHSKFVNVPGEVFGEGAVAQSANLVEMGNAYLSLMMQSAIENVFPVMVLEDAMKAPEVIQRGAGAVIPVNAGGKVYYLQPPAGNLLAQSDWAQRIEQMVKTDTSMPDVNFGVADNSIITGKAINELQGAGTGSLVDMVRGTSIGFTLSSFNEKAITISRLAFADDTIRLFGTLTGSIAELVPQGFGMTLKGSQLKGSTRNEIVFMPYLNMHDKVVIGLQLAGGGVVSRTWQRNQIGIPDSEAMEEEIVSEAILDAVLQMVVTTIATPDQAQEVEAQAIAAISGQPVAAPQTRAGAPPPPGGAPAPGALPPGPPPPTGGPPMGTAPGGGQTMSPALPLPPGSPPPAGAAPEAPAQGPPGEVSPPGEGVDISSAVQAFQGLTVTGRVFLVGEIVESGVASDTVDVNITDPEDRGAVSSVPFPTTVTLIRGTPNGPFVEVTPGGAPTQGGAEPSFDQLNEPFVTGGGEPGMPPEMPGAPA
jgi:hypothetical protein